MNMYNVFSILLFAIFVHFCSGATTQPKLQSAPIEENLSTENTPSISNTLEARSKSLTNDLTDTSIMKLANTLKDNLLQGRTFSSVLNNTNLTVITAVAAINGIFLLGALIYVIKPELFRMCTYFGSGCESREGEINASASPNTLEPYGNGYSNGGYERQMFKRSAKYIAPLMKTFQEAMEKYGQLDQENEHKLYSQ